MQNADKVDNVLIAAGTFIGLGNIENVLGIIIMSIQLIWIIIRVSYSVYHKVKNKRPLDEIKNDIDEAIDDLEDLKKGGTNGRE